MSAEKMLHGIACGCDSCGAEAPTHHPHCAEMPEREPLGMHVPSIAQVMNDPAVSDWLKHALSGALNRDPVDAAHDAECLAEILGARMVRGGP
jgi:hypothetical protein